MEFNMDLDMIYSDIVADAETDVLSVTHTQMSGTNLPAIDAHGADLEPSSSIFQDFVACDSGTQINNECLDEPNADFWSQLDCYETAAPVDDNDEVCWDPKWNPVFEDLYAHVDKEIDQHSSDTLSSKLARVCATLPHNDVDNILGVLHEYHPTLPKTANALLHTPRDTQAFNKYGGDYTYLGVKQGIMTKLAKFSRNYNSVSEVRLSFNVDGVPIFSSNNKSLWPVLGSIENIPDKRPFIVALFCGTTKPEISFLEDTVNEINVLVSNGLDYNGSQIPVKIDYIVADAPARCFIRGVKLISGYNGCDRCEQHGTWSGRVVFLETNSTLRTDHTFRMETAGEGYHLHTSPLCRLPLDMVFDFPCDYMHSVCLGVMRKLLHYWLEGPRTVRISATQKLLMSQNLLRLKGVIPSEFPRKPRTLSEIKHWKATEFRQFLLYTGPHVLKDILKSSVYQHFMLLSVGISILLSSDLTRKHSDLARNLLIQFVRESKDIYGKEFLVYNVHVLVHLADDAERNGCLDNCSGFKFENYLQIVKKMVRSGRNPVIQVVNRMAEFEKCVGSSKDDHIMKISPVPPNNAFTLDAATGKFCLALENLQGSKGTIMCQVFTNGEPLFTSPCASSMIGKYKVSSGNTYIAQLDVDQLTHRAIHIEPQQNNTSHIFMALLHAIC